MFSCNLASRVGEGCDRGRGGPGVIAVSEAALLSNLRRASPSASARAALSPCWSAKLNGEQSGGAAHLDKATRTSGERSMGL